MFTGTFCGITLKILPDHYRASTLLYEWLVLFELASVDENARGEAVTTVDMDRLSLWDAMILATVRQAGCSAILSEDRQDGQRWNGVEIINPFAEDAKAGLALLLEA